MIRLESVYDMASHTATQILWDLLLERAPEASISHRAMPTMDEHIQFVGSVPYRAWYIIMDEADTPLGACYITWRNEIGIGIFRRHQRKGAGREAVRKLIDNHPPHKAQAGMRAGHYVAHVAPGNIQSQRFWENLGGRVIQVTYEVTI